MPTTFNAVVNGGAAPYTYFWQFGDGSGISSQQNPFYVYPGTGSYTATLQVTDANGCKASCALPLTIVVAPEVIAEGLATVLTVGCGTATVSFTDQSGGNPIGWFWDFGDGNTSTLQNPTHTYTQPGIYSVMLVANNGVNYDTTWLPNVVNIPPYPVAGIDAIQKVGCEPFEVQFQDASSGATTWLWDFGDGSPPSALQNPSHTYAQAGVYTVTLTVTNGIAGCSDTHTETNYIQVLAAPDVNFTVNDSVICAWDRVQFTDLTTNGPVTSWHWDFGDGTISTDPNPIHIYDTPAGGGYWVTLTVTGPGPAFCQSTLTKPFYIVVHPKPSADFSPNYATLELPENKVHFTNYSSGYNSLLWNFNTGVPSTATHPTVVFPDSGYYPVWLYVYTQEGCSDTAYGEVFVQEQQILYVPNTFTPDGDYLNENFSVKGKGIRDLEIMIFNRWGEKIFHGRGLDAAWNGSVNNVGPKCPQGTYVYRIIAEYYTGKKVYLTGHVHLIW
ncbi:MAG: PKD domain-containing protein [Flavobacteriales bacterium]|nr:PKD domain-containing protein [Flavobacteriales bacterium]